MLSSVQLEGKDILSQFSPLVTSQLPTKKRQVQEPGMSDSFISQPSVWQPRQDLSNHPPVPQRSLSSPISSSHYLAVDIPKTGGFRISPETKMLIGDAASGMSLEHPHPVGFLRQESYPLTSKDNYRHLETGTHRSDLSQISAVQVTPMSRPRAFPRTNPSYIGTYRRDGQGATYKRISIDPHHGVTSVCSDCFDNLKSRHSHAIYPAPMLTNTLNSRSMYANFAPGLPAVETGPCDDADAEVAAIGMKQQLPLQPDGQLSNCSFLPMHAQKPHPVNKDDGFYIFQEKFHAGDHRQHGGRTAHDAHILQPSSHKPVSGVRLMMTGLQQTTCHHAARHHKTDENVPCQENGHAGSVSLEQRRKSEPEYVNLAAQSSKIKQGKLNLSKRSILGHINSIANSASGNKMEFGISQNGHSPRLGDQYRPIDLCHRLNVTDGLRISSNRGFASKQSDRKHHNIEYNTKHDFFI